MLMLVYLAGIVVALLGVATTAWLWVTLGVALAIFFSFAWATK